MLTTRTISRYGSQSVSHSMSKSTCVGQGEGQGHTVLHRFQLKGSRPIPANIIHCHYHRKDGTVNVTFTGTSDAAKWNTASANMRSLASDDASTNWFCGGYLKIGCTAYGSGSYVRLYIRVGRQPRHTCSHFHVPPSPIHSCSTPSTQPTPHSRVATPTALSPAHHLVGTQITRTKTGMFRSYTHIRHHAIRSPRRRCHHHHHLGTS